MQEHNIALFPLNTVLFPGGPLPLRIFEPRYLRMVSDCMKNDRPFGVCLISEGEEAGEPSVPHEHGTLAWIENWDQLDDGHLGITARGSERFVVQRTTVDEDKLITADVELLGEEDPAEGVDEAYQPLVNLLQKALPQAGDLYKDIEPRWEDPNWVAYRLAELLPQDNDFKLELLQLPTPAERLALVDKYLKTQAQQQQ